MSFGAFVPAPDTPVPAAVAALAGRRPRRGVWANELGGVTWQLGDGPAREFVKWSPASSPVDLAAEAERMRWAVAYVPVPRVLGVGADGEGTWLHTAGLPGVSAVDDRWKRDPATAVRAIAEGLRSFHDTLPVPSCPFTWSVADRVAYAERSAVEGRADPGRWHESHQHLSVDECLAIVCDPPPVDRLVVCHGDTCAPNTLIGDDGRWSGHVDLGALGVADRWADLAIATWSLEWNYGPGWESDFLAIYGIERDPERTAYYRLLWDLGP